MTQPTNPAAPPNRLPLILGAGAGVLLLVFLLSRVLSGGGDDGAERAAPPLSPTPLPVVTPTTSAPGSAPAETFETFNTKNPFVPLRIVSSGGGGTAAPRPGGGATVAPGPTTVTGGPGGGGAGTTVTGGGGGGGTGSGGTAGGTAPGGGGTEPRRGARVALLDVFADGGRTVANVRVNDTVHKVGEGDVFATSFKVVSLSQGEECGRFVFGDDAFRLCKGEESLK